MIGMIGTGELLVIFGVILVLFGGKKLPELARNLGLGIKEFKKACNDNESESQCGTGCCKEKTKSSCSVSCEAKQEDEIVS